MTRQSQEVSENNTVITQIDDVVIDLFYDFYCRQTQWSQSWRDYFTPLIKTASRLGSKQPHRRGCVTQIEHRGLKQPRSRKRRQSESSRLPACSLRSKRIRAEPRGPNRRLVCLQTSQ